MRHPFITENKMRTIQRRVNQEAAKFWAALAAERPRLTVVARMTMEEDMEGENRTPEKKIGEIKHAQEQTKRITGHLPPHGPGAPSREKEDVRANPERDPSKKKTGEF
jgi:hypothetical protein